MDNIELEQKIKEIIAIDNYFEMKIAINKFKPEYKKTEFYKQTKMSLDDVIRDARIHYALHLDTIGLYIQKIINDLSAEKLTAVLDQLSDIFGKENTDISEMIKTIKDIR